jgi:hypothetical protein
MERATMNEVMEKSIYILYTANGEKKVVFDDNTVKALPLELENVPVAKLIKKLNDIKNQQAINEQKINGAEYAGEDVEHSFHVSGEAITEAAFVVSNANKHKPAAIVQLCIDRAGNYNKTEFTELIKALRNEDFIEFCHCIFKIHQFFIRYEGCWCTDAVVLPEEIFKELEVLHYPFDRNHIDIAECETYAGSKYLYDPIDVIQRCIQNCIYKKGEFIDTIQGLTFNQFQTFCKDIFWLMHDSYMSRCSATRPGKPISKAVRKHKDYFWTIKYPYTAVENI